MTNIERIFYKFLTNLDGFYIPITIHKSKDIVSSELITQQEYDTMVSWRNNINQEANNHNRALVESAKSKLSREELEAIKKAGLE